MFISILKAFLIGICASAPLGPTAIFILETSLSKGHRPGFLTGLGATTVDTLYAVISVFFLAIVEEFLNTHKTLILLIGGAVVALVGASIVFKDPFRKLKPEDKVTYSIKDYLRAVALGLSNPTAVITMMTLFAFFNVSVSDQNFNVAPIILAVSAGSASYWFGFSAFFGHIRNNFRLSTLMWVNRIAGVIVMIVGMALLAEGCMKQFMIN